MEPTVTPQPSPISARNVVVVFGLLVGIASATIGGLLISPAVGLLIFGGLATVISVLVGMG